MMKNFSISELESFSGIKAHTIRMWEKRYGFPVPERNNGNIRHYSFDQTKTFLELVLLTHAGCRISKLVPLNEALLEEKSSNINLKGNLQLRAVHQLILLMHASETENFETVLDNCVNSWGVDETIEEVVVPFLQRTRLEQKQVCSEIYFAIPALRRKINLGLEKTRSSFMSSKKALLFLPQGAHDDLVLLYIAYILKKSGIRIFYLGSNISEAVLVNALLEKKPDLIYTYFPLKKETLFNEVINCLSHSLHSSKLFLIQSKFEQPKYSFSNVKCVHFKELSQQLLSMAS